MLQTLYSLRFSKPVRFLFISYNKSKFALPESKSGKVYAYLLRWFYKVSFQIAPIVDSGILKQYWKLISSYGYYS